jgi:hypothetical protein
MILAICEENQLFTIHQQTAKLYHSGAEFERKKFHVSRETKRQERLGGSRTAPTR